MVNKYTLGGVVFGIFLLAIMGIRSATNWLTQSNANTTQQDSVLSSTNRIERDGAYRSADQASGSLNDQNNRISSQTNGNTEIAQSASPLDEAGSYIQRQKRVEQDNAIADSRIDVSPTAQGNTVPTQQPATPTPPPTRAAPATPAPKPATPAPAIEALW